MKVVPRASRSEIVGRQGGRLRIRVAATPERGRANRELEKLLAETLGLARSRVRVVGGHTSALKTVEVRDVGQQDLDDRLAACLGA